MSRIEMDADERAPIVDVAVDDRSAAIAGELFDQLVVPLAQARRSASTEPDFPLSGDDEAATYFERPAVRCMRESDFESHRGDAAGLLDALAAHWDAAGEPELAMLIPQMRLIATALDAEFDQTPQGRKCQAACAIFLRSVSIRWPQAVFSS